MWFYETYAYWVFSIYVLSNLHIEEYCLPGYSAGSPLKVNRRFRGTYHVHNQVRRISRARNQRECRRRDLFFDPEHVGDMSSETSVDFQRTKRRYISEDSTPQNHRYKNLKSYVSIYFFILLSEYSPLNVP
jgi:hypothetical protein